MNKRYLPQYLMEFEYRYNRREMSDPERFAEVLTQTDGAARMGSGGRGPHEK